MLKRQSKSSSKIDETVLEEKWMPKNRSRKTSKHFTLSPSNTKGKAAKWDTVLTENRKVKKKRNRDNSNSLDEKRTNSAKGKKKSGVQKETRINQRADILKRRVLTKARIKQRAEL